MSIIFGDKTISGSMSNENVINEINELKSDTINIITDPDNYPLSKSETNSGPTILAIELGGLSRNDGSETERTDSIRTVDYIPVVAGQNYTLSNSGDYLICIFCYDSSKNFLTNWNDSYSYSYKESGSTIKIPKNAAYIRFYCSKSSDTSVEYTIINENESGGSISNHAEFVKQYFKNHGYAIYGDNIDDETMHKLVIKALGMDENTYNITEIKAPEFNPQEATICLMNWGNGKKQFVDFSSMVYDENNPTVELVCQTRGEKKLPEFSIRYNNGNGAGRVKKFVVKPDAIPMEMTADGLVVRRNNNYDNNATPNELVTVNLADLYDNTILLKSDIFDLYESLFSKEVIESKNYFDLTKITTGKYVDENGNLQPNSAYNSSGYMSVKAGETYTFQYGGLTAVGRGTYVINQIAGYDKNKQFVAGSYKTYHNSYTVPDGVAYVRASLDAGNMTSEKNLAFVKGTTVIDYAEYSEDVTVKEFNQSLIKRDVNNGITYDFSINNNGFESDIEFHHMCANSISFRADITTFNEIRIGKGYQSYLGATLGIDNTNIYVYEGANTNPYITEPHGLTFKDYISLVISCDYGNVASVTIYTNGGKFTRQYFAWDARKGKLFVKPIGTNVLTNCSLGYYCYALEKPTWMYGDSYFTNAQGVTDRWTSYLIGGKHTNYLLNGYSGRGSIIALESLKNDLRLGTPKRIIWCLGMNDGDSETAINNNWKICVDELISICKEKNIELILSTIPNVPTINNSFKNSYVRNSGYRFIDFATSVGASYSTTWYDEMLSSDGVHPSIQGAIALYGQAVADVPELLS